MDLREVASRLQQVALDAVEPRSAVLRHVELEGGDLVVAGRRYPLGDYEKVFLIGGGKAAVPMAFAVAELLGDALTEGVVVTKYGHREAFEREGRSLPARVRVVEGGHPVPDENSVRGAREVVEVARRAGEDDLLVVLISGGGSALMTLLVEGLSLPELQGLTDALLRSGASIDEINAVRKHLSQVKGGHLARLASPATVATLILSDVVGDPLDVIASGPTVPDPATVADAREVLARYAIDEGEGGYPWMETPKPGHEAFERVQHVVVASNRLAARAAVAEARELGLNALLLSTYVEGEAREVARVAAALVKGMRAHGDPLEPLACVVWGGETTVTLRGEGRGGRNQELALAAALALEGWRDVLVMALATDGGDGPTDAAGAVATGDTLARAQALGLDARAALAANDSYPFFDALGDLIRTGPTGTNVNDLLFALVGPGEASSP
jgi:hydroxypyruvate reductase